jgi:hypothetical protein
MLQSGFALLMCGYRTTFFVLYMCQRSSTQVETSAGWMMQKTDMARFLAARGAFDAVHTINVVPFPKEFLDSEDSILGPNADDTVITKLQVG